MAHGRPMIAQTYARGFARGRMRQLRAQCDGMWASAVLQGE